MQQKKQLSLAISAALGFTSSLMMSGVALAQDQQTDENSEAMLEEVVVTGSRIKRTGFDTVSPVAVVSSEEIKMTGQTRIEDMLAQLPQVEASFNSFISNGSSGTATLNLRGLGDNRTLVLVNGRRLQPGGVYSNAPDVNQIPAALVERVEVLTGGASATYGADAVAGVVNFIMKKDFEGMEINAGYTGYQHKNDNSYIQGLLDARGYDYPTGSIGPDGDTYNFDVAIGGSFGDGAGHAVAYAVYRHNNELRQSARDYSACSLNDAGTRCGGSANAIIPNFIIGNADFSDYDYWTLDANGNGFETDSSFWGAIPYNYAAPSHFMRPDTRYSLGAFVDYEINEHLKPYMETSFMKDRTAAQIAESGTFFDTLYFFDLDTPLISDLQRQQLIDRFGLQPGDQWSAYIGKRNVEGGPRSDNLEHSAFRIVLGAEGDINDDWSYDASFQYGETSSSSTYINDFNGNKIITALDPDLCAADDACLLYNVFTLNGVTPEQAAYVGITGIMKGLMKTRVLNAYVTGTPGLTLPSADSPIAVVLGAEYREEMYKIVPDLAYQEGLMLGQGGQQPPVDGSYDVTEVFTEASIPVIEGDMNLSVDLAFRYSDYNTFGGKSTYKIGLEFAPITMLNFRGGYNRAVRAPNGSELFTPSSDGLWTGVDPCSGSAASIAARGFNQQMCAYTGVTPAQYGNISSSPAGQYNHLAGGNPDLQPEIADTYTIGVVVDPMDNLRFSVDYWRIEIEDTIGSIYGNFTGQTVIELCAYSNDPYWCDRVNRSPTGSLWLGKTGKVFDIVENGGQQTWEGVDLAAAYQADAGPGTLQLSLQGTYMITKETVSGATDPIPEAIGDCVGVVSPGCIPQPEWRHVFSATYSQGDWNANLRWRFQGSVDYEGIDDLIAQDNMGSISYFDLSAGYDFSESWSIFAGVNNVLDKEPPLVGGTLPSNANAPFGNYDMLGRQLFATVTIRY